MPLSAALNDPNISAVFEHVYDLSIFLSEVILRSCAPFIINNLNDYPSGSDNIIRVRFY